MSHRVWGASLSVQGTLCSLTLVQAQLALLVCFSVSLTPSRSSVSLWSLRLCIRSLIFLLMTTWLKWVAPRVVSSPSAWYLSEYTEYSPVARDWGSPGFHQELENRLSEEGEGPTWPWVPKSPSLFLQCKMWLRAPLTACTQSAWPLGPAGNVGETARTQSADRERRAPLPQPLLMVL